MDPPWDWGTKVCSGGPGHMTRMAAISIYGKNMKNSSSLEPKGRWSCPYMVKTFQNFLLWNRKATDLEIWNAPLSTTKFVQMKPWVECDLFYSKVKLVPYAFVWEKVETMDFSETIVVYDIKINVYMKLYEYQRSRSFIDLGPNHFGFNTFKLLFLSNRWF